MLRKAFFMLWAFTMALQGAPLSAQTTLSSPSGQLTLSFDMDGTRPQYALTYKGRPVILPSHLGLELARDKHASRGLDETDLMDGFEVAGSQTSSFDETWQPVWGETRDIRNHYNELAVMLRQPATGRQMIVRFQIGRASCRERV